MSAFGQVIIGPPGSGKSTYCAGMSEFLRVMGRKVAVINLDPANETLPYKCDVNISSLITLNDVMDNLKLGPNGGLIYCMEYLDKNMDWLQKELGKFKEHYLLFDCPGQVELYTHHTCVRNIVRQMEKWDYRVRGIYMYVQKCVCVCVCVLCHHFIMNVSVCLSVCIITTTTTIHFICTTTK